MGSLPALKPFPLMEQYKKTWEKRAAVDAMEAEDPEPPLKKKKIEKKGNAPASSSSEKKGTMGAYSPPHSYSRKRNEYMEKLKEGPSHAEASSRWHESNDKKLLLKDVSLSELIRRRFVPSGATSNPFAVRCVHSAFRIHTMLIH